MEIRPFARTGVHVSPLALGAMMFGGMGNTDEDDCIRIIQRAIEAGINLIDTADVYSHGQSEEIVGKALRGVRDDVVIATKFSLPWSTQRNNAGSSRRWINQSVDASLRRLGTDRIDIYQAHRPDPTADVDETVMALDDLVRSGKVLYAGHSSFAPHEIVEAQWAAERHGAHRFVSEQPRYSLLSRGIEGQVLPLCAKYNLGVIVYSPLGGGWLSGRALPTEGKLRTPRARTMPGRYDPTVPENAPVVAAVGALQDLAAESGLSLIQLALGFVLAHPTVSAAIVGPRTMEQLESQLKVDGVTLTTDILAAIDQIVAPAAELTPLPVIQRDTPPPNAPPEATA